MRRIISAKVRNTSGVLNRISGVLTRRQFNIESISVGVTENPDVSRITIVVSVDSDFQMEQLIKQLNKQIDVIKVIDIISCRLILVVATFISASSLSK